MLTKLYFIFKNPHTSGSTQFKPMLFQSQLYFIPGLPHCWTNWSLGLCFLYQAKEINFRRKGLDCPWVPTLFTSVGPESTGVFSPFCFIPCFSKPFLNLTLKAESPWVLANAVCVFPELIENEWCTHPWALTLVTILPSADPSSCPTCLPLSPMSLAVAFPAGTFSSFYLAALPFNT